MICYPGCIKGLQHMKSRDDGPKEQPTKALVVLGKGTKNRHRVGIVITHM